MRRADVGGDDGAVAKRRGMSAGQGIAEMAPHKQSSPATGRRPPSSTAGSTRAPWGGSSRSMNTRFSPMAAIWNIEPLRPMGRRTRQGTRQQVGADRLGCQSLDGWPRRLHGGPREAPPRADGRLTRTARQPADGRDNRRGAAASMLTVGSTRRVESKHGQGSVTRAFACFHTRPSGAGSDEDG